MAQNRPTVLVTSGSSSLATGLAGALNERYRVRLSERTDMASRFDFVRCALDRDANTGALVRGVDAIVHAAEPLPGEDARQQLDWLARGTYNLLWAAWEQKVPRVVFLSTLELMTAYDPDFTVSEAWRPVPTCEPSVLSKHMGEFVCREFARERKIRVVVLRLGKVVRAEEVKGKPADPLWVEERDVARAVMGALTLPLKDPGAGIEGWWSVFHIGADTPRARFSVAAAKGELGYRPQFGW
jgi:nucleoside-diphosphate-sugar epimerase